MKYKHINDLMEDLYQSGGKKQYYCCILYFSDFSKSPIRNVQPTFVTITLDKIKYEEFKNNSRAWFSMSSSWISIESEGKKTLKHKGKCGGNSDDLIYFDTEKECQEYYNDLVFFSINEIKKEKIKLIQKMDKQKEKMKKTFYNSDYMMETLRRN